MQTNYREIAAIPYHCVINDPQDIIGHNNLTIDEIIDLCGGIPIETTTALLIKINAIDQNVLKIEMDTEHYYVERIIEFDSRTIRNSQMKVYNQNRSTGSLLFCNQVESARKHSFSKIVVMAMGPDMDRKAVGHYCWGRMGFIMNSSELEEFEEWKIENNRSESTLTELLSKPEGRELWLKEGFTWYGFFNLKEGSKSSEILNSYLTNKGIYKSHRGRIIRQ